MENNDDDYFSDEFDSLPPGTLYQLEQDAFQATQAPATQLPPESHYAPQEVIPNIRSTTLQPPPRLHTGLTNDYDTLEVGELEAEVHENVGGRMDNRPVEFSEEPRVLITDNGWSVGDGVVDDMEVDQYPQENNYEWSARLKQVSLDHKAP